MKIKYLVLTLIILGILDAAYLSYEHFSGIIPPCPAHPVLGSFVDCGRVLTSKYATIFGVPLAIIGLAYYLFLLVIRSKKFLFLATTFAGVLIYAVLMYIQLFILKSLCLYCTASAVITLLLFFLGVFEKIFSHKN